MSSISTKSKHMPEKEDKVIKSALILKKNQLKIRWRKLFNSHVPKIEGLGLEHGNEIEFVDSIYNSTTSIKESYESIEFHLKNNKL